MFTGIITDVGVVSALEMQGDLRIVIDTMFDVHDIEIGASIACAGVCLTAVDKGLDDGQNWFAADVSAETVQVSNFSDLSAGSLLNLERSLKMGDEMGGHIVTGHVDCVGIIKSMEPFGDSVCMTLDMPKDYGRFVAAKGSITLNGTSLTVNSVLDDRDGTQFTINLIPHTQDVTSFRTAKAGDKINIEIDILARYVSRLAEG